MIDFTQRLTKTFAPQKPHQELPAGLSPVGDNFLILRKRDGQRHYAMWNARGEVRLYSRSMRDMTEHMPMIVSELQDLDIPRCSLLDGEIIVDRRGHDDLRATNEVCRAGAGVARFNERKLPLRYMPFDLLYRDNVAVWKWPYDERWEMLISNVSGNGERVVLPEVFTDFRKAQRRAEKYRWEGLVLWDRRAPNLIRMDGKPARHGCYKWKPVQTGDFVAVGWLPGTGRLAKTMGRLRIAEWQYDFNGEHPKLVQIGTVGTGFDDKTRDAAMRWRYPMVVELKYLLQQEDTRALREPVFVRRHPDKRVKELQ